MTTNAEDLLQIPLSVDPSTLQRECTIEVKKKGVGSHRTQSLMGRGTYIKLPNKQHRMYNSSTLAPRRKESRCAGEAQVPLWTGSGEGRERGEQ